MAIDALSRPEEPTLDDRRVLEIGEAVGPWRISQSEDVGFIWTPTESPTASDLLRFRLCRHQTKRLKGERQRIVLLGESSAGSWGFFGDECLSRMLSEYLSVSDSSRCQVADLTCVNANWRVDCLPLLNAGMTLDPDGVIVFCGNNEARWLLPLVLADEVRNIEGVSELRWRFTEGDLESARELVWPAYLSSIKRCVAETLATCNSFGKPVLFVIPPYNFTGWMPPERLPATLPKDALSRWCGIMARAEKALGMGEHELAAALAEDAILIDGGQCQRSHFMLASSVRVSNPTLALEAYRRAASAGFGPFVQAVPSFTSEAAAQLREVLRDFHAPYLDLAEVFNAQSDSFETSESLFIDYCHLSERGHQLAATKIVEACYQNGIVQQMSAEKAWQGPREGFSNQHEIGLASLCAALHRYQNGQSDVVVARYLEESVHISELLRPLLAWLRDVVCSYRREWITLPYLRSLGITESVLPDRCAIFILKFVYHARFDYRLMEMLSSVLMDGKGLASFKHQTSTMLTNLDGDLKRPFFLDVRAGFGPRQREMSRTGWDRPGDEFVASEMFGAVAFPQSPWEITNLHIVLSSPVKGHGAVANVSFNGEECGQIMAEDAYVSCVLPLPKTDGRSINVLKFHWNSLVGPTDLTNSEVRTGFVDQFGPYAIAAIVDEFRVCGKDL